MRPTIRPDLEARSKMLDAIDALEHAAVEHGRALERRKGTALTLERVRMTRRQSVSAIYTAFGWQEDAS